MAMRSIFVPLSFMPSLKDSLGYGLDVEVHPTVKLFCELLGLTYWCPTVRCDRLGAVEYTNGFGKNKNYTDLQNHSTKFH